jgi:hypothetical protein
MISDRLLQWLKLAAEQTVVHWERRAAQILHYPVPKRGISQSLGRQGLDSGRRCPNSSESEVTEAYRGGEKN